MGGGGGFRIPGCDTWASMTVGITSADSLTFFFIKEQLVFFSHPVNYCFHKI